MPGQAVMGITIAVYFALMLGIGLANSRRSKSITDFTVGKRSAGAWMSALSYGTAYFSAVMFIGYSGTSGWKYGAWGVLVGIGNAVFGSLLAWRVLARRTREVTHRLKIKSMPQFFEKRFQSRGMKGFAVAITFLFLLPYSASVYKGLTSVCAVLLDIDERLCMVAIAVAAGIIVVLGGYSALLKADFVQGIIMIVGVALLIVTVVRCDTVINAGGLDGLMRETAALKLGGRDFLGLAATILMTSFGTWGLPQMVHKYYVIKDDHEIRRGTVISTGFALLVAGGGYFIGSLSRLFFTELPPGKYDFLVPNMLNTAGIPTMLLGVVLVLLISASVSTLSSITVTASSTLTMDFIHSRLVPSMSKEKTGLVTKGVCAAFVVLSFVIANTDTPILDMMAYSWGILAGSFMAPYLLSLYWKGLNRAGGWAGMLGGFAVALPPVVCKLLFPSAALPGLGNVWELGPHFACAAIAVSLLLSVAVSAAASAGKWRSGEANPAFYDKQTV